MIDADTLRHIAVWATDLKPEELERARRGMTMKSYGRGAHVFHRGDEFQHWGGMIEGLMQFGWTDSTGRSISFGGLPPGMWFGEGSLLKSERRLYEVAALRDSRVALMNKATFDWLVENSVGFNRFLVRQFNERLGQFIALVEHARTLDATGRVARNLAWLVNPVLAPRVGACLEVSQEELGQLSGVSRQAANAALKTLVAQGLVMVDHRCVTVLNRAKLAAYGAD